MRILIQLVLPSLLRRRLKLMPYLLITLLMLERCRWHNLLPHYPELMVNGTSGQGHCLPCCFGVYQGLRLVQPITISLEVVRAGTGNQVFIFDPLGVCGH